MFSMAAIGREGAKVLSTHRQIERKKEERKRGRGGRK